MGRKRRWWLGWRPWWKRRRQRHWSCWRRLGRRTGSWSWLGLSSGGVSLWIMNGRLGIAYQLVHETMVEVRMGLVSVHGQLVMVKVVACWIES